MKEKILYLVKEYYTKNFNSEKVFTPGDRINYGGRYFDEKELVNLIDSSLEFWLTSGRYTDEFEKGLSKYLGIRFCSLVNSGSSANLLAFMTLTSPLLKERSIKRGDEVITVAAGFPTTIAPIIQYGAVPVFVDVTIPEYNIDTSVLEEALSEKTKAVMIAHTLGNPFNIKVVKEFCSKHDLWLIEDNCDALGSEYCTADSQGLLSSNTACVETSNENASISPITESTEDSEEKSGSYFKKTGTFGDIGTSSFYPPHHMTMGEGGAVYTDNPLLHKIIRSMRDWGRDCSCPSGMDNLCGHRFDKKYGELPIGYDHKYVYSHFGYNLKATDMQAAIGCAQLEKLPDITRIRRQNFDTLYDGLKDLEDKLILPKATDNSKPSWFGFLMTCVDKKDRDQLVSFLENRNIQTRMLFAGNILRHPCFDSMRDQLNKEYRTIGNLPVTDRIMNDSFWIGVYPGMTEGMIEYMIRSIHDYFKKV